MKKVLMVLLAGIITQSCSKESQRFCYECNTKTYRNQNGSSPVITNNKSTLCDKTEAEIREYMKSSTKTFTQNGYNYGVIVTCDKK